MTTSSITLQFDSATLALVEHQAALAGVSVNEFVRDAILEKLEDRFDYTTAARIIRDSNDQTISRAEIIAKLRQK